MRFATSHLPEARSAGIGTWSHRYSRKLWLPGFRRAGPSTPLDENPYQIVKRRDHTMALRSCQARFPRSGHSATHIPGYLLVPANWPR